MNGIQVYDPTVTQGSRIILITGSTIEITIRVVCAYPHDLEVSYIFTLGLDQFSDDLVTFDVCGIRVGESRGGVSGSAHRG